VPTFLPLNLALFFQPPLTRWKPALLSFLPVVSGAALTLIVTVKSSFT
jgi:hypothetical protein